MTGGTPVLSDSRLGTISNRRLNTPTLSELRLGLEVNEGGSTHGSGIRVDRGADTQEDFNSARKLPSFSKMYVEE